MNMQYRVINWLLLVLVLILGVNIIRSGVDFSRRDGVIKQAQERLNQVKENNKDLKKQLAKVESQEFVEKEARNRLNLAKEGELVVILPSISPIIRLTPTPIDTSPHWQKWVRLFL